MPDTQQTVWAQAYSNNIMQLAQDKSAKLLRTVYVKPNVKGKVFYQDQIGKWSMEQKGGRNVQTPNNDPNLARRMATMVDYHDNRLLDRGDDLRMISDPRSAYTIAGGMSLGRQIDTIIASAAVGTANYGETGSSSVTLGTDLISGISHIAGTPATLTLARVLQAKRILDREGVEPDERYFAVTPFGLEQLLNITQATSADYNTVRALVQGELNTWVGFEWIMSNQLSASGTTTSCFAYHRNGICVAMADQPLVRTDERADLSYSWQIYYELNIGSVRLEEARVVLVNVNEA